MSNITKKIHRYFLERHPLEVNMMLWVTIAVALVTIVFGSIASKIYYDYYEKQLQEEIYDNVDQSTKSISLIMGYVKNTICTTAEYAQDKAKDKKNIDSILVETLRGFGRADEIGIIYRKNYFHHTKYNFERAAYYDHNGRIKLEASALNTKYDENWQKSYGEGRYFWSDPYTSEFNGEQMICFSTPLLEKNDKPYAILYASIQLKWITPIVEKYKACKDIDVSIYSQNGQCIVSQVEEITKMDKKDLIVQERTLKELGWKLVFSVPKDYINAKVHKVLLSIAFFAVILLFGVVIAIYISVVKVARPFVREQRALAESEAKMQSEMEIAASTQNDIIPHTFPPFPGRKDIELYAMLKPALNVGGDLYDYFMQDDKLHFCIGDVSGKGMPASLFMSATRYLFRSQASSQTSISSAVENINRSLCTDNVNCTFVTFFYGCLDLRTGLLQYCNAGHNFPIIHDATAGTVSFLSNNETDMPLGVFDEAEYTTSTLQMAPGDTLFLYTDGVTESMNIENQELGDAETIACIRSNISQDTTTIINAMRQRISKHAGEALQSDDITMLCIRLKVEGLENK